MAAPHVAGVAALILDAVGKNSAGEWNFSPNEVKSAIVRGAERGRPIPLTPDNEYGAGLVRADKIIFGDEVNPGTTRRFKITPALVGYKFPDGYLNAENNYSPNTIPNHVDYVAAISWESRHILELKLINQVGTHPDRILADTTNSNDPNVQRGSNYRKIAGSYLSTNQGGLSGALYLDVHNPGNMPVRFTGASTQPIEPVVVPIPPKVVPTNTTTVAYFPFDGNAKDASGNDNHGEIKGTANYVEGKFGDAIALNNGVYVEMEASDSLHGDLFKADPFTLAAWIYPKAGTRYGHVWRSNPIGAGHNTLFIIGDEGGISWRARINGQWSWEHLCETEPGLVKADEWIHVAVTNDGDKFRIYANGEVVAETNFQQTDGGNTTYSIGSRYTSGETFAGLIDDYAVFSTALNKDEINLIMETSVARFLQTTQLADIEDTGLPEDVNGDGIVDIRDLVAVSKAAALESVGLDIGENRADVNGDGEVNIQDLVAVAAAIGEVAAAPAALRQQGAAHLTQEEVQHWLTAAQQANLTDATSVRGIRFLEQLLSAMIPKETALLPNYPNPFNPETWIPYQLATPANVTLTIYDIQGRVVRDLDLGHQRAGMYHTRSRAAYWDGRNTVGEPVASGVYFYTLTAGDFTATRKLLIRK